MFFHPPILREKLSRTHWEGKDPKTFLMRCEGAEYKNVRISGLRQTKGVVLPLSAFRIEEKIENEIGNHSGDFEPLTKGIDFK